MKKGLEAVEKLPQPDFDARSMKSSILYQMGKLEESEKLTQRCLYEEIRNAGLSLVSLAKIAGEESEYEKAFRFLDAAQELETLFEESRLGGVNVMVSQMKLGILVKQGKKRPGAFRTEASGYGVSEYCTRKKDRDSNLL